MSAPTVLIADDDPQQLKLMGIHLRQAGFEVVTAKDGAEALEEVKRKRPDAVVSDVLMPRLNGFQLCRSLRQDPQLASLPVLLISSGSIEETDLRLAGTMGANAYVQRMPDCRELIQIVGEAVASRSSWRAEGRDISFTELEDRFLLDGAVESRLLQRNAASGFDPAMAARVAHHWAGLAGTLGFPQISQLAFQIEGLARQPLPEGAHRLQAALVEIGRLFTEAARSRQKVGLSPKLVSALSGKTIALLGFDVSEVSRLAQAFAQAGASACSLALAATPPGSEALQPCQLVVLNVAAVLKYSPWNRAQDLRANTKPLLVVGPLEILSAPDAAIREAAADFLLAPWFAGEAVMRACRVLREAPELQLRRSAGVENSRRAVIADDDPMATALATAALQQEGIRCHIARNGGEALEMTRQLHPDLVVLDINMPRLNGFEVLSALKKVPATQAIPVVLLTARQREADVLEGFALGASDYVIKPFSLQELAARVRRLLAG